MALSKIPVASYHNLHPQDILYSPLNKDEGVSYFCFLNEEQLNHKKKSPIRISITTLNYKLGSSSGSTYRKWGLTKTPEPEIITLVNLPSSLHSIYIISQFNNGRNKTHTKTQFHVNTSPSSRRELGD